MAALFLTSSVRILKQAVGELEGWGLVRYHESTREDPLRRLIYLAAAFGVLMFLMELAKAVVVWAVNLRE